MYYENIWRQNGAPEHQRFWKHIQASITLYSGAIVLPSNKNDKNEECIILVHNVPDTGGCTGLLLAWEQHISRHGYQFPTQTNMIPSFIAGCPMR